MIQIKTTKQVEGTMSLPEYFAHGNSYYAINVDKQVYIRVTPLEVNVDLMLFPSIKVDNVRYLQYEGLPNDVRTISKNEFRLMLLKAEQIIEISDYEQTRTSWIYLSRHRQVY